MGGCMGKAIASYMRKVTGSIPGRGCPDLYCVSAANGWFYIHKLQYL